MWISIILGNDNSPKRSWWYQFSFTTDQSRVQKEQQRQNKWSLFSTGSLMRLFCSPGSDWTETLTTPYLPTHCLQYLPLHDNIPHNFLIALSLKALLRYCVSHLPFFMSHSVDHTVQDGVALRNLARIPPGIWDVKEDCE